MRTNSYATIARSVCQPKAYWFPQLVHFYWQRLEAQLKAYQNKHGVQRLDEQLRENLDEEPNVLPPWVASKAALSPLLIAYDERIAELTTATEECASQLRRVTRELNDSSQENKRLQAELATKHEERIKSIERGLGRSAVGPEGGLDDLDEQLHVVLRENAVLTDQVTLFESEVARLTDEGKVGLWLLTLALQKLD